MTQATFADLTTLSPELVQAVNALGFNQPTPVQFAAIGTILQGRDVLVSAQTGSGKTAAFALPVLQMALAGRAAQQRMAINTAQRAPTRRVFGLVLVPTRELAAQVGGVFREMASRIAEHQDAADVGDADDTRPLKIATLFGGVSINPQMMALRGGADIVVATPGRLLDLVASNAVSLSTTAVLVLDEADRLLDLGFADELKSVLDLLPVRRQNLFFSATLPDAVQSLAAQLLHEPSVITIEASEQTTPDIRQRAIAVDPVQRTQLLRHLIQTEGHKRVLVFVATKFAAHTVAEKLRKAKIAAAPFHADLAQGTRTQVLADLKSGKWDVVVTTDLASRGIDVTALNLVVNYDLPRSADDYTHRIGRTARAGASGLAINFVSADTDAHLRLIEKRHGLSLVREQIAGFEPKQLMPNPHHNEAFQAAGLDPMGGIKGKRPSKKDKLRAQVGADGQLVSPD